MKTVDSLRKLIYNSTVETSVQADQRILNDALERLEKVRQDRLAAARPNIGSIIMRSPITKLATAAIVAIACLIGLSLWKGTESGIALADVLARVEQVKAVRYKWTYTFSGYTGPNEPLSQEVRATCLNSAEHGTKIKWEWTDPNSGENRFSDMYLLTQKKIRIRITPNLKKYERMVLNDAQVEEMQKENPNIEDPLAFLKKILKTKYESMGKSTMDGVEVAGFRTTDPNSWPGKNPKTDFKLWVDVKTLLPVRYDILASVQVDEMGDRASTHVVTHDFQWDVSVDPAEFEPPPVPDDYVVLDNSPGQVNEDTAIQGLKLCDELLGKYPEEIRDVDETVLPLIEKSETLASLRLKEELKGLTKQERDIRLIRSATPILKLEVFHYVLIQDNKDPAYYGKTVTPKDADKVLMRWKVSDSEYRVIFGDLHAETVTKEKLAELEAAMPK